jgi:hypothetical protein
MIVERVHSVWDYYDGILTGVADYRGTPHYFEKDWSVELKDYLSTFTLTPISESELREVVEREHVFRTWEAKFHRGEAEGSTHPGGDGGASSYFPAQKSGAVFDEAAQPRSRRFLHERTSAFGPDDRELA